jgi:hypothetical protein
MAALMGKHLVARSAAPKEQWKASHWVERTVFRSAGLKAVSWVLWLAVRKVCQSAAWTAGWKALERDATRAASMGCVLADN